MPIIQKESSFGKKNKTVSLYKKKIKKLKKKNKKQSRKNTKLRKATIGLGVGTIVPGPLGGISALSALGTGIALGVGRAKSKKGRKKIKKLRKKVRKVKYK